MMVFVNHKVNRINKNLVNAANFVNFFEMHSSVTSREDGSDEWGAQYAAHGGIMLQRK